MSRHARDAALLKAVEVYEAARLSGASSMDAMRVAVAAQIPTQDELAQALRGRVDHPYLVASTVLALLNEAES